MAIVTNMPPCMASKDTSRVPPPKSTTIILYTPFILCRPYARAAAVGSLITLYTSKPASRNYNINANALRQSGRVNNREVALMIAVKGILLTHVVSACTFTVNGKPHLSSNRVLNDLQRPNASKL